MVTRKKEHPSDSCCLTLPGKFARVKTSSSRATNQLTFRLAVPTRQRPASRRCTPARAAWWFAKMRQLVAEGSERPPALRDCPIGSR